MFLSFLCNKEGKNAMTKQEAEGIRIQLERLITPFMQIFWHFLLSGFNAVRQRLQKGGWSIADVVKDYRGLTKVIPGTWNEFEIYEKKAENISELIFIEENKTTVSRKKEEKITC